MAEDAEVLVRPIAERAGFELVDVIHVNEAGRPILRVVVDRPEGADLDELAQFSAQLSAQLSQHPDLQGLEAGAQTLEVSTPGLERPLRRPGHFQRSLGELVKVKTTTPVSGSKVHTGTLVSADGEAVTIAVAGEGPEGLRLPYADIASARTVVDWDAELKRSKA